MTEDHCLVQQKPCMVCILAHNIGREISDALVLSSQEELNDYFVCNFSSILDRRAEA